MAYPDICLYASHYGTSGAGRNGIYEEPIFAQIVPRATEILRAQGFNTVYHGGLGGHEMDQHIADEYVYDVTISNHFNVGSAFLIFNGNHNNPHLNKMLSEVNAVFRRYGIVHASGGLNSDQYAMTNYGKSDNYLIEWADCQKPNELAWITQIEERAWDLADIVRKVYLDGKPARANGSAPSPKPTPQPKPTPSGSWGDGMIGMTIGNETIDIARDEIGGLTWFRFTTGDNPIFPTLEDAIYGTNADSVRLEVGDEIEYWGVIRTDKYTYLVYDRDNGTKGHVIYENRTTGAVYGEIL